MKLEWNANVLDVRWIKKAKTRTITAKPTSAKAKTLAIRKRLAKVAATKTA